MPRWSGRWVTRPCGAGMRAEAPALVIGAGPAGLMAADQLLRAGLPVVLAEAKPSIGRKFLMAGKSGLNLTKNESLPVFVSRYAESADWLAPMLAEFGPEQVQSWACDLGQPVFTGSSGRVFPVVMKASPLLRAWASELLARGLDLRTRWRLVQLGTDTATFDTPEGRLHQTFRVCILALGGASWARLGSDGAWTAILSERDVALAPFQPANMGFTVRWSAHMEPHFGAPLKSIALRAGTHVVRGEAVVTARGLEGGGVYAVSRALREGSALQIDLFPDTDTDRLAQRLAARPGAESVGNTLRKLGLAGVRLALALECARPFPPDPKARAAILKAVPIPIDGPNPMDEAISTAGGIRRDALTDTFMLRALPGVFAAGEMLDWEAPTGGYLLTACLATGRWAGRAAALWSIQNTGQDQTAP